MPTELTNEQMFKLVCMEVIETMGTGYLPPVGILYDLVDGRLTELCERMIFIDDDGKLDEGEIFLLDWMKQNAGNWGIIQELWPVAERLEDKLRY